MTEKTRYMAKVGAVTVKVLKVAIITVALLTVIVMSLLPFVLRWEIVSLFEQKDMAAEIGYIDIRPIMGSLQINDVHITAPDGKRLYVDEIQMKITWSSLANRWLNIKHVIIEGTTLDIVAGENGVRVAGFEFLADDESPSSEPDVESEPVGQVITRLVLEKLELDKLEVCFAKLNKQNEEAFHHCARIKHLSLIDNIDLHLGENPSALIPGIVLNSFRWSDQQTHTELVSVESLNVTNVTSGDMKDWQLEALSLEALRVLPISVEGEMTAGDLWLNALTLTDLKIGEANNVGTLSLTNLNVDLRSDNEGMLALAPALMARINQLAPEDKEDAPEPTEQAGSFSMGRLDVNKIVVRDAGDETELVPTPLAFIDGFNIVSLSSSDMVDWQLGELSVGMLKVLPTSEKGEMTAGDLQLKSLSLSGLEVGSANKIGGLSLASVKVDLQSTDDGRLVFAPVLMERIGQLAPENDEDAPEVPEQSSSFSMGNLDVNEVIVHNRGVNPGHEPTPLLFVDSLKMADLNSPDMTDWKMGELSVGVLKVLPTSEKGEMIAGDLQLNTLSLTGLEIGDAGKIDTLSLASAEVDLQSGDNGVLAFAPALMEQLQLSSSSVDEAAEETPEVSNESSSFSVGRLVVSKAVVHDARRDKELLSLNAFSLQQLETRGDTIGLGKLQLSDLKLLELEPSHGMKTKHYFSTPKIELAGLVKEAGQLKASNILVADPVVFLHRSADGGLAMLKDIERMMGSDGSEQASPVEGGESPPTKLSIGNIKIGGNGQLLVLDESVSPEFKRTFAGLDFTVNNVNANAPDTYANIKFNLGLSKFSYLRFGGKLAPFGDKLDTAITGELRGLDVRYWSAYAAEYIGYHLDQGIGEADIVFDVNQDDIDATITTRFHKLEVLPLREDEIPEGSEALGVPLEFALGLLRDGDGMIELKLPISGDIHSPNFSLRHIIGKVMFKVISEAIVNYYMPFGLIMGATMQDTLSNLNFEPVLFAPGEAELDAAAISSLDKLSEMLGSRQQLHLSFCAPSTRQDWSVKFAPPVDPEEQKHAEASAGVGGLAGATQQYPAIVIAPEHEATLKALANQRSETVKGHLISAGVQPGQVILCDGAFEKNNIELPQMDIAI
jgi:hypothetical protein